MKITFINRMAGIARGGGETFDLSAARALVDQGCEVTLVTGRRLGRRGELVGGLPVKYVATPYLRWLMYWGEGRTGCAARRLAGLGKRVDLLLFEGAAFFAIAFSPLRHSHVFQLCSLPRLASWLHRHLHKVTVVRWPGPPNAQVGRWSGQYSADVANGAALAEARRHLPHTFEVPTGMDARLFHGRNGKGENTLCRLLQAGGDKVIVLYVGRLVAVKNLDLLLLGFCGALAAGAALRLILVGDGSERRRLEERARELGIAGEVVFAGRQPHNMLPQFYRAADLFALTSAYDNFPNAVLEAMASELPVIATRVGGVPAMVEDGVSGLLVEDRAQLAAALATLARDPELRRRMGAAGRARVTAQYSWAATAAALLRVYAGCWRSREMPSLFGGHAGASLPQSRGEKLTARARGL